MQNRVAFQGYAIVACGTMNMELNHLKNSGFLDARKILYTKPGRHEIPRELESQLIRQIGIAKKYASKIIVVYGGKFCYVNADNPNRDIDTIIQEQEEPGIKISRIKATHCVDMLASNQERERISQGKDVYWLTPGWMKYRHYVYQGCDKSLANKNFPKHTGGALMLDAIGYYEEVMKNNPEKILEFSDWMGIPIEPYSISLDRLISLLSDEISLENKKEGNQGTPAESYAAAQRGQGSASATLQGLTRAARAFGGKAGLQEPGGVEGQTSKLASGKG